MSPQFARTAVRVAKRTMFATGVFALCRRFGVDDGGVTILCYHSVSDSADYCGRDIAVTPASFAEQVRYLSRNYEVLSLDQVVSSRAEGRRLSPRAVCITFDDGYRDNFEYAYPVLKREGLMATFFVTADPVLRGARFWVGWLHRRILGAKDPAAVAEICGISAPRGGHWKYSARRAVIDQISRIANDGGLEARARILAEVERATIPRSNEIATRMMMNVAELRELVAGGMAVGAHSATHPVLAALSDQEARAEIESSKRDLESAIDAPVLHFAYPNGPCAGSNFTDRTAALVEAAGFRSASTSVRGALILGADPFAMPRQGINDRIDAAALAFKLEERRFSFLIRAAERVSA